MDTGPALLQTFNKQEPIPGYVVKELLGTGGYGEVWKCHAPGGLFKAVKIICADPTSKRASSELRSLSRIKEVRHPFLLSIERIEVIDGNVVIVTELADHSLKRQFQKQRAKGAPGIPREELLGYLRDAADALDFIYDNYSLQHLDIKPENLLVVGNRAKVADFGMIKNLYDRAHSAIEGLTPAYAPPEVFEGKPNRHSDQYSLAVVYLEMLTGALPFDGTTAAQLAAQHLHMAPSLSALPKCDHPVVARALSKDPAQRFASCRALIDNLVDAHNSKAYKSNVIAVSPDKSNSVPERCFTQALNEGFEVAELPQVQPRRHSGHLPPLPTIELDAAVAHFEPVLFVGIGGTATRVLRQLRRRIHDRLGPLEMLPAIDMLLIDTDIRSLNRATDGEYGTALDGNDRLPMPLRRSEEYRASAGDILASIGRRWLFNVPYSLETDGFRPLGRLALVDHSARLIDRLKRSLTKITNDESLAQCSRSSRLEFVSRQPRVFVVASSAGGTGSGMVLDTAYAIRTVLAKLDLPDANVHGILLHSTAQGQRDRDRAIANSYATLSELWHYSKPGNCYPGDRGCKLPAFHGNNRTFASCYFVHLGDELTDLQFNLATDPIAEYLYTSSFTKAAPFLDRCRQLEYVRWGTELTEPIVRTFGLAQLGGSNSEVPAVVAELLCRDLVFRWHSGAQCDGGRTAALPTITAALAISEHASPRCPFPDIEASAAHTALELGLAIDPMTKAVHELFDEELPPSGQVLFAKLIESARVDGLENQKARLIASIDSKLSCGDEATLDSVATTVNTRIEGKAAKLAANICDWIFTLVDGPSGVAGAQYAAEWFRHKLRDLESVTDTQIARVREEALSVQHAILRTRDDGRPSRISIWYRKKPTDGLDALLQSYATVQLDQAIACLVSRWIRLVEAQINSELERLQTLWKDLTALAGQFHVGQACEHGFDCNAAFDEAPSHWRKVLNALMCRRHVLVETLDREIDRNLALTLPKLRWYLEHNQAIDIQMATPLRAAARQLTLAAMHELNVSHLGIEDASAEDGPDYKACLDSTEQSIASLAAGSRLILVVPEESNIEKVRAEFSKQCSQEPTVIRSNGGDLIACQEYELVEIRDAAASLIGNRRDFIEVAKRLHTRVDVMWSEMPVEDRNPISLETSRTGDLETAGGGVM